MSKRQWINKSGNKEKSRFTNMDLRVVSEKWQLKPCL